MRIAHLLGLLVSLLGCGAVDESPLEAPQGAAVGAASAELVVTPGRVAAFGFPRGLGQGGDVAELRFWRNRADDETRDLTGVNDRQLAGDFLDRGHDQVLFLDYWGGTRRWTIGDFSGTGALGEVPIRLEGGAGREDVFFNGWDDERDLAFAGDFLQEGFDQLLLINRDPPSSPEEAARTGRLAILDVRDGTPRGRLWKTWAEMPEVGLTEDEDVLVAGDFTGVGHAQLAIFNSSLTPTDGGLYVLDFHPEGLPVYSRTVANLPELVGWNELADQRIVGDFMGRGHDQILFIDRLSGPGGARIVDLTSDVPSVHLPMTDTSVLLAGWRDDGDLAFAGDFTGSGHDELLLVNTAGTDGRVMVLEYASGAPVIRYLEAWNRSNLLGGWLDADDTVVAGRLHPGRTSALLSFNNADLPVDRRVVRSATELENTLRSHFTGDVVVPPGSVFDLGNSHDIPIRSGVHLLGERGPRGSRPLLQTSLLGLPGNDGEGGNGLVPYGMFLVTGNGARIEGIHLRGSQGPDRTTGEWNSGIAVSQDAVHRRGRDIVIRDNELERWGAAISVSALPPDVVRAKMGELDPVTLASDYRAGRPRIPWNAPYLPRIAGNHIHHNNRDGFGYGVVGSTFVAEGNTFDRNRHVVSSGGAPYDSYLAYRNYVLEGGYTEFGKVSSYWNQHFDVHGSGDLDGNGWVDEKGAWYGGIAGEHFEIGWNTIRGEQGYNVLATRPALMLRGRVSGGISFHDNVVVHNDRDAAVRLKGPGAGWSGWGMSDTPGNTYDTDHSMEIGVGDFDADGADDVFVATGTGWFYSSGANEGWRYLQATNLTSSWLYFANVDGDPRTDVIWQDAVGNVVYSSGGTGAPAILPQTAARIADLRFHDMNEDGIDDVFLADGVRFQVLDGATRRWRLLRYATQRASELRLGRFDGAISADVLVVTNGRLMISSGGTAAFAAVAGSPVRSLAGVVVGSLDEDLSRDDVAWQSGDTWVVSSAGRGAVRTLASAALLGPQVGSYPAPGETYVTPRYRDLRAVRWGDFDGNGRMDAVRFERTVTKSTGETILSGTPLVNGQRFVLYMNAGGLAQRMSPHAMR